MGEEETKNILPEANPPIDEKSPAISEKGSGPAAAEKSEGADDRDAVLQRVEKEKRWALIKAWEESEKTKVENKAHKTLCAVEVWEKTKKASAEAEIKKIEEKFERKKAEYAEKMKNKTAEVHRAAEEKRAMIDARRGEEKLKIEERAAKFRASGNVPKGLFGCFSF
ncbi:hypothetical protein NMG60_11030434 [Bertholletia excelsa]